jgi:hypothetical protein
MKQLLLLVSLLIPIHAQANGLFLELGIGNDIQLHQEDQNPRGVVRLRYELDVSEWWLPSVMEWNHHSSVFLGPPFNNRYEPTTDQFSVVWRFKLF